MERNDYNISFYTISLNFSICCSTCRSCSTWIEGLVNEFVGTPPVLTVWVPINTPINQCDAGIYCRRSKYDRAATSLIELWPISRAPGHHAKDNWTWSHSLADLLLGVCLSLTVFVAHLLHCWPSSAMIPSLSTRHLCKLPPTISNPTLS